MKIPLFVAAPKRSSHSLKPDAAANSINLRPDGLITPRHAKLTSTDIVTVRGTAGLLKV